MAAFRPASALYEKKHLRPKKLGPPDVYPQEAKQREDELTAVNVKQGFLSTPNISDEYGSARHANISCNKFGAIFSALLAKKQDHNTFDDKVKRKQCLYQKDGLWLVTQRTKPMVDLWFKDLATGSKNLSHLAKKVPIFHKKEEILQHLFEYQVPMSRAAFYIKASTAVQQATQDTGNKGKKRQTNDPGQEWTATICRGLRDLFNSLSELYNQTGIASLSASLSSPEPLVRWNYLMQLARHMFEECLLDRCEFLSWLEDLFERIKPEDPVLRLIAPHLLHYSEDFADHELLSRKLAYHCAKRLNILLQEPLSAQDTTRDAENGGKGVCMQQELLSCPHHRSMTLIYSAIIQCIAIKCRTALVWHHAIEGKSPASLSGSPLDHLPCPPSALPIAKNGLADAIRQELLEAEDEIRIRSIAVENKWASDRLRTSHSSPTIRQLTALDVLDKHSFDRIDANNSLDSLYHKIFSNITHQRTSDGEDNAFVQEMVNQDEVKVRLLCEWAVTHKRTGEYRSLVVAKLLERRQSELLQEKDADGGDERESDSDSTSRSLSAPVFQQILLNFLDTQAPVLDERTPRPEVRISFSNLVLLFSELMRIDVFSHDAYMCALISRGLFADNPVSAPPAPHSSSDLRTASSNTPFLTGFNNSTSHGPPNGMSEPLHRNASDSSLSMFGEPVDSANRDSAPWMGNQNEIDDAGIDADLDKLLQNIKEGQRDNMHDQDILLPDAVAPEKEEDGPQTAPESGKSGVQRHIMYTTHFPLPQDETTLHECNQRHILLYGVGKARDEARHAVKKVTKDILRLFSRKASFDLSDGGKVKKSVVKDGFSFESALSRFQSLPFFDQHAVTASCASTCIEMMNAVATGTASYLPLVESIAFLFDLMDMSLNVNGMMNFIIQMLKELPEVEVQLHQRCAIIAGRYCTSIGLYIVGVLFRYQPCLLTSADDTRAVFQGSLKLVTSVVNPADCTSSERCILGYIFDLYSSCSTLQSEFHSDGLSHLLKSVKLVIYTQVNPSALNLVSSANYMMEYISNPSLSLDPSVLKQLKDNPTSRYSFVCNAVRSIALTKDPNHLNELAILCAELSSRCPPLSAEWIGVLKALCCSSNHACGFIDALSSREVSDLSIHDNLAIFTSILVARRCFTLQDFVIHCALPSLLAACPQGGGDIEAESGARLTCHLLLCLFRTSEPPLSSTTTTVTPATTLYSLTSPGPANLTPNTNRPTYVIKHPCDRYLLAAAHSCMRVEAVIAVLKAILVLGDANSDLSQRQEVNVSDLLERIDDFNDFVLPNFSGGSGSRSARTENLEPPGLGEFAKHALKQICSQEWVHEKCLRDREMLCKQDLLLDTMLTSRQAQLLLDMICHPKGSGAVIDSEQDQKLYIYRILQTLDEWTLRISWLQLQLIYAQCNSSQSSNEVNSWLENVAKATIEFFQNCSENNSPKASSRTAGSSKNSKGNQTKAPPPAPETGESKESRVWLVAPLISKLPTALQGKILRVAANVLETVNWMAPVPSQSSKNKDRSSQPKAASASSALLSYSPFLSLVHTCLKGQDEQRETLLKSLYSQLEQAVGERVTDDYKTKIAIHDGLQLRLSLVGGMMDMITKSNTVLGEWSLLLLNLMANGTVDPQLNYELFTTVMDMLSVLIHATQVPDADTKEESKRHYHYQNLMKKLRKELPTDRNSFAINFLKQLVPPSKFFIDVVTCEPMGSLIDTKGNKIAGFDSIDKKQGLQVASKVQVNPWELLEGQKNPPPLSWSWFGVVRYERKPLRCDEVVNSLQWHSHSLTKPSSYYLEPPPVPPEEVEPVPAPPPPPPAVPVDVKPVLTTAPLLTPQMQTFALHMNPEEVIKREAMTPELSSSPRAAAKAKPKQTRKRRAAKNSPVAPPGHQTPPVRMPASISPAFETAGYGPGVGPQHPPPPPSAQVQVPQQQAWYGPPGGQMAQVTGQSGYYNQPVKQAMPAAVPPAPRYERNPAPGKAALNSMLRARSQPYGMTGQGNAVPNQTPGPHGFQQRAMAPNRAMRPANSGPQAPGNQMMMQSQNQGMYHMQNPGNGPQMQHHMQSGGGYAGHQQPQAMYQNQMAGPGMQQQIDQSHTSLMPQSVNQHMNQGMNQPMNQPMNQNMNQGMNQMMGQSVGPGNGGSAAMGQQMYNQQQPSNQMMQQRMAMQPQGHHMQQQQFMQRPQYASGPSPNVTMGTMGPHSFAQQQQQQQQQQQMGAGQHAGHRPQLLQRQLSQGQHPGYGQHQQQPPPPPF